MDVSLATLNTEAKRTANQFDPGQGMSLAEADEILARYGYVDAEAAVTA